MKTAFPLTYDVYLNGRGQGDTQLVVLNNENQLVGPAYRWAAINSNLARALGWRPSAKTPFQWLGPTGDVVVESTYWKDGWRWIAPPRVDSLGEGWFVSASAAALRQSVASHPKRRFICGLSAILTGSGNTRGSGTCPDRL